jgi:serine/threonine protein kinase/tetratricopeptide (TPR) repeat protein
MRADRWERLQEVFHGAAGRDPGERGAYLDEACAGDTALRQEVEALLAAQGEGEDLAIEVERLAASALAGERLVGAHVGPYRVVRELGQGGMGRVYLAHRDDDQFQRRVAVKLADTAQAPDVEERFRSERQILAALDHPNIARLLDGGSTAEGVPYLVLEYVEGEPVDRYCDLRQLDVGERLQLFRTVCSAVHYAHQNLVVHRDLKPSNVLVTGEGTPKLLDFGIAKLLKPELLARLPALTTALHRPMTPEYASPEQVRGETVTTASDVYSLGVLLYELLTGCRPLRLDGSGLGIERTVSEVEPEPPSRAALRPAEGPGDRAPEERARDRRTTPERLRRRLEGDLDNIVMMALRKAPARRYASAEQLAEDVRRTSDGLPVRARKDTIRYRVRKFVGRNRYTVSTALVFLALIVGFGINRARLARDLAQERDRARQEAETARHVASFLEDVFRLADPTGMHGSTVTAREILDRAAARLADPGNERPGVRSKLLDTMGVVYRHLGLYGRAEPLLEEALALRRRTRGEDNVDTAQSLLHLGQLRVDQARYAEGEDLLRRSLRVEERLLGQDAPGVAEALYTLGYVLRQEGKTAEAETVLRRVVALREAAENDEVDLALALDRLASVLQDQGKLREAERLARRAVDITRRRLGHHVDTARCLERLGNVLTLEGRYAAAEPLLQEGLAIRREKLGPDHPAVGAALDRLADLKRERGDFAGAEPLYRKGLAISLAAFGEEHLQVASIRADLAEQLLEQGRLDEAQDLFTRSLEARNRLGPDNPFALASREGLARVVAARGDLAAAETAFRQVLDARRRSGFASGLPASATLLGLGEVLLARRQTAEAEPMLRQALELRLAALPAHHWQVAEARGALGACLTAQQRYGEAEPLLVQALADLRGRPDAGRVAARLVRLYEAWGRPDEAQAYRGLAAPL